MMVHLNGEFLKSENALLHFHMCSHHAHVFVPLLLSAQDLSLHDVIATFLFNGYQKRLYL